MPGRAAGKTGHLLAWAGLCLAAGASLCSTAAAAAAVSNSSSTSSSSFHPEQWCAQVTPRLPRVSREQCVKSALSATGTVSVRRMQIASRRFKADRQSARPLSILLVGGIHGDELTSSAVVFEWMRILAAQPRQEHHWHMVPLLNPDGMLARPATRVNANGVDLNRNFPTPNWQQEAPAWWVRQTGRDPRRYPGRTPLSEPESRWLHQEIERNKPDLVVAVHAPYKLLDYDGPAPPPERFGSLRIERIGVFPGSLGNYGGYQKKVPVITIELPNARQMPSAEETRRIWDDMQGWIKLKLRSQPTAANH